MKFNSNPNRECSNCRFFKDGGPSFGEPSGTCTLKNRLFELLTSFGIKSDIWMISTGNFAHCDVKQEMDKYF